MAISPTQRQRAAQARFAEVKPEATTWFWRGYLPGSPGQVGIVVDGDGVEQRGTITGNTQPRIGAPISFKPGQPIGEITLPTVDIVGGGGSATVPSGEAEAFPFRLDGQPDGTYTIDPYQHYRVRVEALEGVSGGTVTVSPAVGSIAEVGAAISITVSGSASGTPVLGTVLLRRVG